MSQPISSSSSSPPSSSSPEDSNHPPPPPPPPPLSTPPPPPTTHPSRDVSYARIPGISGEDWSRTLVRRLVPHFDASRINPNVIPTIAGATAGLVSGIFTCPLDVIKTKLQAQGGWIRASARKRGGIASEARYRGLVGTSRLIWKEEGVRGMYRGLGPLILGYLPTWMVYFTVYERTKTALDPLTEEKWLTHLLAAITGGASSTVCTNPIWVIKTRLMSQAAAPSLKSSLYYYNNTFDAARKMYLHEGIRSFYSGLAPALLGLTHVGVQFPVYEYLKSKFTGGVGLGEQGANGKTNMGGILAASCLSKICASSATYPHEVLRTRLQTQRVLNNTTAALKRESPFPRYRGILHSVGTIYREEGWRAFYSGMGTNMVRAVPSSAMTLLTYELVNGFLTRLREESIQHYGRVRNE